MHTASDEKQLKPCLTTIINIAHECLQKLKLNDDQQQPQLQPKQDTTTDVLLENSQLNNNVYTFTLNNDQNELLDTLTSEIQATLNQYLPHLSEICSNYLLDFLHLYHYDRETRQFNSSLTMNVLHSFHRELQGLLASSEAFPAAFNGQLEVVKQFIEQYPTFKDKPGLWETTLLYSAARNNRFDIVKHLIEHAHCSVNAQNQRDMRFALDAAATDFTPRPTAASTALHGACFNNHLAVVQYLVEHGADYFIRNQAHETPIMNGEFNVDIRKYFEDYLLISYSIEPPAHLPDRPIEDEDQRPIQDCMWEYKPLQDREWYKFSSHEAGELHQALLPSKEFQQQIYLKVRQGLYNVSIVEFLRSGKVEQDPQKNMAWVRCRGSSVLNFDCYSLWQIMLIQHHQANSKATATPSLKIQQLPTIFNSKFQLHLNTWYKCDNKTGSLLDKSMNYRRKLISINIPFVGDHLKFNLQTFSFANDDKTIVGYVRWIPKLISNNEKSKQKIVVIDNYQIMANMQPIPLTTKHMKDVLQMKNADQKQGDDLVNQEDDDQDSSQTVASYGIGGDDEADDEDSLESNDRNQTSVSNNGTWSVTDLNEEIATPKSSSRPVSATATTTTAGENANVSPDQFFNEKVGRLKQPSVIEKSNSTLNTETTASLSSKLEAENQKLKEQIQQEQSKVERLAQSQQKMTKEKEQQLQQTIERLDQLQQQLGSQDAREQKIKDLTKQIKTIDYNNIESIVVQNFLLIKREHIIKHLDKLQRMDDYFVGKIPKIAIEDRNTFYEVSLTGFQAHHDEFKMVLQRIQTLSNVTQSAKEYYQRKLNESTKAITRILTQQIRPSQDWKYYTNYFLQLIKNKTQEYVKLFDDYITKKSKAIIEKCITDRNFQSWTELQKKTDKYIRNQPLMSDIEALKHEALEEYIKQQVLLPQSKFEKKPSKKSIQIMNEFIAKVKTEFKTMPMFIGTDFEHFRHIPRLLQRIMLYYRCFLLQLPLYESAQELLNKIEKNTAITIATSTGSGKSTLLPALLIAEGYEKVIVTQPRRLPCTSICDRVNETMTTSKDEFNLAGWAVSGAERDVKARILYLTDGLLKERLLYDENLMTNQTNINKSVVFFIDEVHERSVNIDLCLALIARLLTEKPELKSKIKVIISSATLDSSVPTLYRQIPQLKFDEFKMPMMGTLYPVTKFERPNANILDVVQELYKKRQRHDQILCFVNSVSDVHQCCRLLQEISHGTIIAYPLIQSQSAADQQLNIEHGSVFFSTTVAETSLTFPSLKYVVDTGMINIPVYDLQTKQTTLQETRAAESTIKQRLGRLGRTKPGEYYSLYDFKIDEKKYPTAQICQSELINIEFSLRKSSLKNGLNYMKKFLPDSPSPQAINLAVEELRKLRILTPQEQFTSIGVSMSKLPDFGSLAMSKSVLSALQQNNCGRDLIVLSSILSVLNTSSLLKTLPNQMKSSDGDFMTLLNVMNEILLVKQSVPAKQFSLARVCQAKGLVSVEHILKQALRRYVNLEKSFNLSDTYRAKAQVASGDWELIAKSLLNGYGENVFVSMKELQGKTHRFTRYHSPKEDFAVLDLQSTLTRPISSAPVPLLLARDIRYSSAVRATAVLSFVGEIKSQWIEYQMERKLVLNAAEEAKLNADGILSKAKQTFSNVQMQLVNHTLILKGPSGSVLDAELDIIQQLVVEIKFSLTNDFQPNTSADYKRMKRNLESVMKMTRIFNPMKWRWEAQHQVKLTINNNTINNVCEITIEGRDSQNQLAQKEFQSFLRWLKNCAVIRHPNSGVSPRILKPQMRKACLDIEERISHVTDSKRTAIDLWNGLKGSKATRETRMEVVAWIAVCQFDCRVEGGFVRDWIIGKYTNRPAGNPSSWLSYNINAAGTPIPFMNKELIPSDLDCHLPAHIYFDIDKFLDYLHKYHIDCQVFREEWRYVLLLDENAKTGPFTMDLIEPHVALTHDRIDFDVSNLSLEKDYTKELGMRVDVQHKPYSIELETIVDNIKNKRFQVLRPIDGIVQERINKMNTRGWSQLGEPMHVIPDPPPKYQVVLVPLPESTALYQSLVQQMKNFLGNQVRVLSIEQIKNPLVEDAYLSMKQLIAKQCNGQIPNERELFHGTKGAAIDGILNDGFDDRYWGTNYSKGNWGHGAYFADNPLVSHGYTEPDPTDQTRIMYYNKVALGNESVLQELNQELMSAPKGYHSTHGKYPGNLHADEYIVYRYGQALPYLKITYKT